MIDPTGILLGGQIDEHCSTWYSLDGFLRVGGLDTWYQRRDLRSRRPVRHTLAGNNHCNLRRRLLISTGLLRAQHHERLRGKNHVVFFFFQNVK